MLTVLEGAHSAQVVLAGFHGAAADFHLDSDGHGGTLVTLVADTSAGTVEMVAPAHDAMV